MDNIDKKYSIPFIILFIISMFFKPAFCFLMLGMLLFLYAIYSIFSLNEINKNGIESIGKIVSHESDNEGYKTPIVEFQISDEKSFRGKPFLHISSDLDKFRSFQKDVNKTIKILYHPENPEKFILKDNSNGFGSVILIIAGLIFISISVASLLGYIDAFN